MEKFDLNSWLADHGYTQASLARALDVSRWTVKRNQERGESPRQFVLACKALALHTCGPTEIEVDSHSAGSQAQNHDGTINRT